MASSYELPTGLTMEGNWRESVGPFSKNGLPTPTNVLAPPIRAYHVRAPNGFVLAFGTQTDRGSRPLVWSATLVPNTAFWTSKKAVRLIVSLLPLPPSGMELWAWDMSLKSYGVLWSQLYFVERLPHQDWPDPAPPDLNAPTRRISLT